MKGHRGHMQGGGHDHGTMLEDMHQETIWALFVNIMLGAWLVSSPFALGYFGDLAGIDAARATAERALESVAERNRWLAWSDIVSGAFVIGLGFLSLSRRYSWAQWGIAFVGVWLLFAPVVFWAPAPVIYVNDTVVGALLVAFSVLIPMMPGMSMEGMMGGPDVPPGWNYCPSTAAQRAPIVGLALVGFLISRYLTAYQMGYISAAWDPFFGTGTEDIITSDVSKAWPVPDAALGAISYVLEVLMGVMGDKRRWRTMPWMVTFFGILVVPLGVVSIYFIIIQPIVIGTWCTLCLAAALAMVVMIPYSLDELVAMGQFLVYAKRAGKPFWRTFFMGDAMPGGAEDKSSGFRGSPGAVALDMARGVTLSWPLVLNCAIGVWLMFTRITLGASDTMANSDHFVGALVITLSVIAMAEVARVLRFINLAFAFWLVLAPWIVDGATVAGTWASVVAGVLLAVLAFPRGPIANRYAGWDRVVF